jgi:branched-chain amino acid transport system permease protein
MHKLPVNRKTLSVATGAAMLLALPAVAGMAGEPYLVTLFSRILIYALAAVSLDLMLGFGGMVSLGHAAFFGIGAYVVGILSVHGVEGTPMLVWPVELGGHQSGWCCGRPLFYFPLRPLP